MSLPLWSDWVPLLEEERMVDQEQEEEASLITKKKEEDRHNALKTTHADPSLDMCPDWNPSIHSIIWDI